MSAFSSSRSSSFPLEENKPLRALLFWNKHARQGELLQELRDEIASHAAIGQIVDSLEELDQLLADDAADFTAVIAAGGDGTLHDVINSLLAHDIHVPFGIVPLGTGNDLCRSLQIPNQPAQVMQALLAGKWSLQPLDLVQIALDGKLLFMHNVLAAGVSAEVSQQITSEQKETLGPFAYMTGMLQVFSTLQTYQIRYQCDERPAASSECLNFFVANGRMCGGGIEVSPASEVDDGQLQLVTYLPMTGFDRATLLTDYLIGRYEEHPAVRVESFQKLELESKTEIPLSIDGEIHTCKRLDVEILPSRLQVLIPQLTPAAT